eukprot:TRINITY_DN1123_c0_g1_i1.p1 TRINITY_DN1123_c0_g1~~TRINITY_DN1123_c0_g1_i1.p1  ORF type:complete len:104 (+),score=23.24 TRINITY_DN1123_c0_g1_i1:25-312(+)
MKTAFLLSLATLILSIITIALADVGELHDTEEMQVTCSQNKCCIYQQSGKLYFDTVYNGRCNQYYGGTARKCNEVCVGADFGAERRCEALNCESA